jgi:predicted ATPase/DNA-binding SARP family transcriptional activator
MSRLALFLLGSPRIELNGTPIKVDRHKVIALPIYLAVTGEGHTRDALATMFWPESSHAHARTALRRTILLLKQAIGAEWLEIEREKLALKRNPGFWLDVDHFHSLLAECRTHGHPESQVCRVCLNSLAQAVQLYHGDFLAGFNLGDTPDFDEWQFFQSLGLRSQVSSALERLARGHSAQGEFEPALLYAQRWLALDPLHEPAHCLLMQLYVRAGRRATAMHQYRECVRILGRELGVPPQEETTGLYQAIQENRWPPPAVGLSPSIATPRPHNLPLPSTPFFGREKELAEINRLLNDSTCRLLTLFGPGGIGKTRLALQACLQAAKRTGPFSQGVYFVSLVSHRSADLIAPAVANELQFPFHGGADLEGQILDYLREKDMLLVLDNLEHLLDGTGLLVKILENVPGVKLLVTSRERLNLRWEWLLDINGLAFPEKAQADDIESYSAAQLFLQSARQVQPAFLPSEEEKLAIARICQFLEGMPLGIEMAAAWVQMLPCQEIARRIRGDLGFLTTTLRDVPERHRSLRTVFDHSWNLLLEEEKSVCSKLSVFRGGFQGEAVAEWVAGASLAILSILMRKSFLRRAASGRYDMLEVLREYAHEKLQQAPQEWNEAHDRHCKYYAEFLQQREGRLKGERQKEALEEIGEQVSNVRAAWQWAIERRKTKEIAQSLDSLSFFYEVRSWYQEGEAALGEAVEALRGVASATGEGEKEDQALLGQILARQGRFCFLLSFFEKAENLLQTSLVFFRTLGLQREAASCINNLGNVSLRLGKCMEAKRLYQEGLAIYREIGDPRGIADGLNSLGVATRRLGEYREAERLFREGLTLYREIGDRRGVARCLNNLGNAADDLNQYAESRKLYQESLVICKEIGDRWGIAKCLGNLGLAVGRLGEHMEAKELYQQSLAIYRETGGRREVANSLNNLGFTLCAIEEYQQAGQCFQEAMEIATNIQVTSLTLEALVGKATILMAERKKEQATELVAYVFHHPDVEPEVKRRARSLLARLKA